MAEEITKKQKDFADEYLETGNGTQAALKAYDTDNENTAAVLASNNIRKHKVQAYLEDKAEKAAIRVVELSEQDINLPVALGASKDVLDRAGYKPIEKQEIKLEDKSQMGYERAKQIVGIREGSDRGDLPA